MTKREPQPSVPCNIHAERVVLGAILLDGDYFRKVVGKLEPEDFMLDMHRRIFLAMATLADAGTAIDMVTLTEWLRVNGHLKEMGETPVAYCASLTEGLPRRPHLREYLVILREKRKLRTIIGACERAMKRAMQEAETADEIAADLREKLVFGSPSEGVQ